MARLILGNCLDRLADLPDNSVDAVVTDPPYGLTANKKGGSGGFMGQKWDADVPSTVVWQECLRVLKPGGYLLAFAGTRTQHRMAVRIEDAGFEIRDMIAWVYATGFPKSHNLRGDREGWGTALKPAMEPITVARKPMVGTVAANVQWYGTGAMNIAASKIGADPITVKGYRGANGQTWEAGGMLAANVVREPTQHTGRWPANLIHDGSEEVLTLFPDSRSGAVKAGTLGGHSENREVYGEYMGYEMPGIEASSGSAARFFYCAKASTSERGEGNTHPTVKPLSLMRYLCRLVTPPGGTVLDPFMGSGTTGLAAQAEGFDFIGIEREPGYFEMARDRLAHAAGALWADNAQGETHD